MKVSYENEITKYRRKGNLTGKKLMEYIPALLITNVSNLILNSVDSVIAGNFVSADALSAINCFYPVTLFTSSISVLAASGISTSLSTAMGRNDPSETDRIKGVSARLMILMAIVMGIVQIPIVYVVIRSYGLSDEMYTLIWQYAAGIMISAPLGLISNVGTYELQCSGKMKPLMYLSVAEGASNIAFDLLFTGLLDMGIAGVGYGTACSNLIRCTATVIYIARCTDIYKSNTKTATLSDMTGILWRGVPDAASTLAAAFQNYFMIQILLAAFGSDGGVIKGVCALTYSFANVFMNSISGGSRSLAGLLAGADDRKGLELLLLQGSLLNVILTGPATLFILIDTEWFFSIYGVSEIPDGGLLAVRLYSLYLVLKGIGFLFKIYFNNCGDSGFSTVQSFLNHAVIVLFAYILYRTMSAPLILLAYLLAEIVMFALSCVRYRYLLNKGWKEGREDGLELVLSMTVKSGEAEDAASELKSCAEEKGIDAELYGRVAECMQKMIEYSTASSDRELMVSVMVKFYQESDTLLVTLDDGECISLSADEELQKLIEEHGEEMKELAKNVDYEYILNMNYARATF